jgi:hypothetical protein
MCFVTQINTDKDNKKENNLPLAADNSIRLAIYLKSKKTRSELLELPTIRK